MLRDDALAPHQPGEPGGRGGGAQLLGVQLDEINIEPAMEAFGGMLSGVLAGHEADITEENIQSRARGLTLMAISNKLGHMVLSTGNKSEMSVGYATLYGDMCGGFNVLKDVYKTTVFPCPRRNQANPRGALGPAGRVIPSGSSPSRPRPSSSPTRPTRSRRPTRRSTTC